MNDSTLVALPAHLSVVDLTDAIDRLPRKPGHQTLPPRGREEWITFHYSAVVYTDRSRAAELARVIDEAAYQIGKNWAKPGRPPIYGDGLMYDLVVLSDGTIVRTRKRRQQLWHCGNAIGNRESWSVHVMLGAGQDLMGPQRVSVVALFDALRTQSNIPRANVVGHCEWPRGDDPPVRSATYRLLPGQSECPGRTLFSVVATYRAAEPPSPPPAPKLAQRYRVAGLPVYEGPAETFPIALGGAAFLPSGAEIVIDEIKLEWKGLGHLASGLGWVRLDALEPL